MPDVTDEVFRYGTESPASVLLDAVHQLDKKSPKADDNIQLIKSNLPDAVDTCVAAAGHEFNVHWQKQLLKAASFGKSVLDIYNSDDFVDMCEKLRVINAVRFYEVGLPLSYEQFLRLTPEGLIKRLINRHEYALALRVADYLRLPTDRIYVHWASAKVRVGAEDDETICDMVVQKLAGKPGISFEAIAQAAYHEGRGRLATELLNHEPRAGRQVPLLLSMEEDEIALDKAIESGDSDLIIFVLLHLKKKLPLAAFFRVINARPAATALVESSAAREGDHALLKDLYYQDDRRIDGAGVFVREALRQPDARTAGDKLALAAKLMSDSKENQFEVLALKDAAKLLRMQETLERDLTDAFTGLSVNETLFKLIQMGDQSKAKKLQSEFKVPEKVAWWIRYEFPPDVFFSLFFSFFLVPSFRAPHPPRRTFREPPAPGFGQMGGGGGAEQKVRFCQLTRFDTQKSRLRALIAKRDWTEIEDMAKIKKSPIGWEPFFNQALEAGNKRVAGKFVPKCTGLDPADVLVMYEKCGLWVKAAEEAVKMKDQDAWSRVLEAAEGRMSAEGREVERVGKQAFGK